MKKLILLVTLIFFSSIYCQTFVGTTGVVTQVNSCYQSQVEFSATVSGLDNLKRLESITLNFTGSSYSLDVWLVAPNGATAQILSDDTAGTLLNTKLSCHSKIDIGSDRNPYLGTYLLKDVERFNGINLNGVWKLRVCDSHVNGNTGTISWSMTFFEPQNPIDLSELVTTNITTTQTVSAAIYGKVFEPGLTDTSNYANNNIEAWIGYSAMNTNPNTWTNWIPALFNQNVVDGDEYKALIGRNLTPGTYYYAVKFKINGEFYAGYGGTGGNWNGINHNNGILTVSPPVVPTNDNVCNAIPITVNPDNSCYIVNQVSPTASTPAAMSNPSCNPERSDVWYTFVALSTTHKIFFTYYSGGMSYSLWKGTDCNNLTIVGGTCDTTVVRLLPGLIIGQTYYLRLSTANPQSLQTFDICLGTDPSTPESVALHSPQSGVITAESSLEVRARIYKSGLTDVYNNRPKSMSVMIGCSTSNTNPATWNNWTGMSFNSREGNSHEYKGNLRIPYGYTNEGIVYYAIRVQFYETTLYFYGGISDDGIGGTWDGTTYKNGILTVNPAIPPINDECLDAIPIDVGSNYFEYTTIGETFGAINETSLPSGCNSDLVHHSVFYKTIAPESGNIIFEMRSNNNYTTYYNLSAFTGNCSSPTQIKCGWWTDTTTYPFGNSYKCRIQMSELIPGEIVYLRVSIADITYPYPFNNIPYSSRSFEISAYWNDYFMETPAYAFDKFITFPNPVKDVLYISNDIELTKFEIYNMLGQNIRSGSINARDVQINMSDLSKGIYLAHIFSSNQIKVLKVIKE